MPVSTDGDFKELTLENPADLTESEKLKTYFKGTLGVDYSIGDFYTNLQYNYGFFDERGKDLTHLLMLSSNYSFLDDKIKLELVGGVEIDYDKSNSEEAILPSWILGPQFVFKPYDATSITLGAMI